MWILSRKVTGPDLYIQRLALFYGKWIEEARMEQGHEKEAIEIVREEMMVAQNQSSRGVEKGPDSDYMLNSELVPTRLAVN